MPPGGRPERDGMDASNSDEDRVDDETAGHPTAIFWTVPLPIDEVLHASSSSTGVHNATDIKGRMAIDFPGRYRGDPSHRHPKAPQSTGPPEEPLPGLLHLPQRRAGESPRGTTQQPQCKSPRELQRRAHRPPRQLSAPEQIQPWTPRTQEVVPFPPGVEISRPPQHLNLVWESPGSCLNLSDPGLDPSPQRPPS
ncbi:hypothetical protein CRENBAI_025168 [Crenichthys baileyi]|uniref:Uncharacterized protein n=1 Tax=Crenichthys baileyi TaxID=28760 RepID=A0AAV9S2N6_9TELE